MISICHLCGQKKDICNSHILPKFIEKYLKETSATGYIRTLSNPNQRQQKFQTEKLFCKDCEDVFSREEKAFCEQMFLPHLKKPQQEYEYDEWLSRFVISLGYKRIVSSIVDLSKEFQMRIEEAKNIWRDYLLGNRTDYGLYKINIILLGYITETTLALPSGNSYLMRIPDITYARTETEISLYIKLPGFVFWINIEPKFMVKNSENTEIQKQGRLESGYKYIYDSRIGDFINSRAVLVSEGKQLLSEKQKQKISDDYLKNPDRAINSETVKAYILDKNRKKKKD
jgi:hypothetical protein